MQEPGQPGAQQTTTWSPGTGGVAGGFDFMSFLTFRQMITPAVGTVVYVIGAVLILLAAILSLASNVLGAVLILVLGEVFWRVYMELVLVLFRIHSAVEGIDRRGQKL